MKVNLFFFISNFNYGGAGNAILSFLKNLDRSKFAVSIFFLNNSSYKNDIPKDVKIFQLKTKAPIFKTFFSFFKIKKILIKESFGKKKNIFISNIHFSNILSIFFLRKIDKLKIFLFERTSIKELDIYLSFISFLKNKFIKFLIKFLYLKADLVISNSLTGKKEFSEIGISSKTVFSGSIKKIYKKKIFRKNKIFKIISVGRLTEQKNHFLLINSLKYVICKNFRLFIYGDGKLKNKLTKNIFKNQLNAKVKLMAHENNKKKIYQDADLLVHTALFEGLPNCIVECINYSVPVIACNGVGAIPELLSNGKYGKIIKNFDEREISKNIDMFIKNPKKLRKKIIKARFKLNQFKEKQTTRNLEKLILKNFIN